MILDLIKFVFATVPWQIILFAFMAVLGGVWAADNNIRAPARGLGMVFTVACYFCYVPARYGLRYAGRAFEHAGLGRGSLKRRWEVAAEANNRDAGRIIDVQSIVVQGETVGQLFFVAMPPGSIATDYNPERIASSFSRAVLVTVNEDPNDKGVAHVCVYTRQPLQETIEAGPLEPTDAPAGLVTIGLSYDGDPLVIDTRLAHVKTGGQTRYGKSNFLHLIAGHYCQRADTILVFLDGKSQEAFRWTRRGFVVADYTDENGRLIVNPEDVPDDTQHLKRAAEALKRCVQEMGQRRRLTVAAGFSNVQDMEKAGHAVPGALLVLVDEVPRYLDDEAYGRSIYASLMLLVREGLAANVHVVLSTQKATGDAIPTSIRDICECGVAFRCETYTMGEAILGSAALGQQAAQLPRGGAHRGRVLVATSDGEHRLGRCAFADDAWLVAAAACTPRRDLPPLIYEVDKGADRDLDAPEASGRAGARRRRGGKPGPKPNSATAAATAAHARDAQRALRAQRDNPDPPPAEDGAS